MISGKSLIGNNLDFKNIKYSLDTNILIYAFEKSDYYISEIAINLIRPEASISNYTFQEFLFKLTKKRILKKDVSKMGIDLLSILNLN